MSLLDKRLEIFRMAATLGNFSDAAAALGMTQSNITQRIAGLEKEFGIRLFEPSGRGRRLTPAGTALLENCERLFTETGEIARLMRNAAGGIRRYRIGGTMTAGGYLLPELAARYMAAHPEERIEIHVANTLEISDMLKCRSLELALVEGPFDRDYFISELFLEDEMVPVAAPGGLAECFDLTAYCRAGGKWILREPGSGTRYHFDRYLQRLGIPGPDEDNVIVVNSFDAVKNLVRGGYGITVISRLAVRDEVVSGRLMCSRFREGELRRSIDFIYAPGDVAGFAEGFISFCRRRLRAGDFPEWAGCGGTEQPGENK